MTTPITTVDLGEQIQSCFVAMPFAPTFQSEYIRVIKPAIEAIGLLAVRGDEVYSKPRIVDDIWKSIRQCRLVVAELSGRNPNVLYEVGLAQAIGKPVVFLTREEGDVPFDLKALRYLFYDVQNPFWGDDLKIQLTSLIKTALHEQELHSYLDGISAPDNSLPVPIRSTLPIPTTELIPFDISGLWQAAGAIEARDVTSVTRVLIVTQTGAALSAVEISTHLNKGATAPNVIEQQMSGSIVANKVIFRGTSYTYLQRGEGEVDDDFSLDSFDLSLSEDGRLLSGSASDDIGTEYEELTFRKLA